MDDIRRGLWNICRPVKELWASFRCGFSASMDSSRIRWRFTYLFQAQRRDVRRGDRSHFFGLLSLISAETDEKRL